MEPDFSGWATKANLKCTDGRTIMPEAFAHMDGQQVPLVWQHSHNNPSNVLGHAVLYARPEGLWTEGFFNKTKSAGDARALLEHKDVNTLSIYANQLVEKSKQVFHGMIREVSLVLSGANPGAKIENVRIAHSYDDDIEVLEDEAVIFTGLELVHSSTGRPDDMAPSDDKSIAEVYETLNEEQKTVVQYMIGVALETGGDDGDEIAQSDLELEHAEAETLKDVYASLSDIQKKLVHFMIGTALEDAESASHSDLNNSEDSLTHQKGDNMSRNLFEQTDAVADGPTLSHDDLETIQQNALKVGSYKEAFFAHAESLGYGIDDIDFLFPDAKNLTNQPDLISRRTEWVKKIVDGAKHSPFSRIKSTAFDVTAEAARAKGYVKGNLKKDEVIKLLKRVTTPTTIYKKQKLDRDDIVDITDLDVVTWLKWEMRFMLEEEIARAILIGDGREPDDEDKIDEDHLRPIAFDVDMYAEKVNLASNATQVQVEDGILRARSKYKGTGTPTMFTTDEVLTNLFLQRDGDGRRIYKTVEEVAAALRVAEIVVVEVMEDTPEILAIIVNLADYTIGADRGGAISMFDDFDIDYNQYKYLIETRISGALTKPKSALVVRQAPGNVVTPTQPPYNSTTHVITIPADTGVIYSIDGVDKTAGALPAITETTEVEARAAAGYSFPHGTDADWVFVY